jgi:hypothetical protein
VNEDSDLRERFGSLRQEDAARAPGFERVLKRTHRGNARRFGVRAAGAAAALAVLTLTMFHFLHERTIPPPSMAVPALADWRAPTDFLLNAPVDALLHAVPRIGEPSFTVPLLQADPYDITPVRRAGPEHHS